MRFCFTGNKKALVSTPRDKGSNLCGTTLLAVKNDPSHPSNNRQPDNGGNPVQTYWIPVRPESSEVIFIGSSALTRTARQLSAASHPITLPLQRDL